MIDAFGVERPDLEVEKGWKKGLAAGATVGAGIAAAANPAVRSAVMGVARGSKLVAPGLGNKAKYGMGALKHVGRVAAVKPTGLAAAGGAAGGAGVGAALAPKKPKAF